MRLGILLAALSCTACAAIDQPGADGTTAGREVPLPRFIVRDLVREEFRPGRAIEFDAYAVHSGELRLYDSEEAARLDLIYPYCLSADSRDLDSGEKRALDGKWVRVVGTLLEEDPYEPEPNTIRTMSTAGGMIFANGCWGRLLLRIDSIERIAQPDADDD